MRGTDAQHTRRRKVLLVNSLYVFLGYWIPLGALVVARIFDLASFDMGNVVSLWSLCFACMLVFFFLIATRKKISRAFASGITYANFVFWLGLYSYMVSFLNEIRLSALFFALIALVFLLSSTRFAISMTLSICIVVIYTSVSYYAIVYLGQEGSMKEEAFYALIFFAIAVFISIVSQKFDRQRKEVRAIAAELGGKNAQILETQDQLILQEKMATLGQVTAGIAHEIKNPLNFVTNFAEGSVGLADDLIEALEKQRDSLEPADFEDLIELIQELRQNAVDIGDSGKRADSIVRNMMDHARGTKDERRVIDLNTMTLENLDLAYHGYRARFPSFNVELRKLVDGSLPVEVIPQDLSRVLLNLLTNACYAVHEKQQTAGGAYAPTITVSTRPGPEAVEIRIRDNGPGIPAEIRDQIFNPFFTTKPSGEGNTGLGLSIAYEIVTQGHHGTIEVLSDPGEFTEFVIRLPTAG